MAEKRQDTDDRYGWFWVGGDRRQYQVFPASSSWWQALMSRCRFFAWNILRILRNLRRTMI